jgi:HPt (histidine-containing phosphotransfer) domain-containing protein
MLKTASSENARNVESPLSVDHERIEGMIEQFGEETFAEIVSAFLEDMEKALADLEQASVASDPGELDRILHLVRGSASNIGLTGLAAACEKVKSRRRPVEEAGSLQLLGFNASCRKALRELRRQYGSPV